MQYAIRAAAEEAIQTSVLKYDSSVFQSSLHHLLVSNLRQVTQPPKSFFNCKPT